MGYQATILADSANPSGNRLTTFELRFPRLILPEFLTHRMFSRNAASSRAIPTEKMIEQVLTDPVLAVFWGQNQPGMQAQEELTGHDLTLAQAYWLEARDEAVQHARRLQVLGAHKQIVNRLLEPWLWVTVICSATEYQNFFRLRCHEDAQPEMRHLAERMRKAYRASVPVALRPGDWHLPLTGFFGDEDLSPSERVQVSVGRCARVSYLTHQGTRDVAADLALHRRLQEAGHWSPFEHAAQALPTSEPVGNFTGFRQYRKLFPAEGAPRWDEQS